MKLLLTLFVTFLLLSSFVPLKEVWLEDSVATGGRWATTDPLGGHHYTLTRLSLFDLARYRNHYEPARDF